MGHRTGVLTAVFLAMAGAAPAQELVDRGYFNGWNVMVDPQLGNGCLIQSARRVQDALVRIGYDRTSRRGYLVIFSPNFKKVSKGRDYDLIFQLDGERYPAVATGLKMDRTAGVGVHFTNLDVFDAIAAGDVLSVFTADGQPQLSVDLTGTSDAIAAARQCQAEMGGA